VRHHVRQHHAGPRRAASVFAIERKQPALLALPIISRKIIHGMSDPRILSAILNAPAFLSGLSAAEFKVVRERARAALHPEQVQTQQQLTKSLEELREGLAAAKRLLLERCELRDDDGQLHSIHEPLQRGALTG
jgi:hypothetical protein